ncbi:hypothetical protein M8C21_016643 [Ambrosia artemisiifolia]|uniref:CCHC-type domain-containing protein n=1 Tax=Ambrosia artemisiifolia TaxID=4212 RepID=A0AAD5CYM4_AMBAR|nr:hypothetical protein M8C21_016643 [Ambrosia artemisiifolia]
MDDEETRRPGFRVRKNLTHEEVLELYVGAPSLFSIKLHHNERFTRFPDRTYVEREENFIDLLDHDKFSVHEMDRILKKIGYQKDIERYYHYQVPSSDLDFGLRALGSDADVIGFIKVILECRLINVYCEYGIATVHTYFCSPIKVRVDEITDEELMAFDLDKVVRNRLLLRWHGDDKPEANQGVVDNSDEVVVNQDTTQSMHTDEVMDNHVNNVHTEEVVDNQLHNMHTEEVVVNHVDNMHTEQVVENMHFHFSFDFSNIDLNDPNFDPFFGESPTVNVPKHDVPKHDQPQDNMHEHDNENVDEGLNINEHESDDDNASEDSDFLVDEGNLINEVETDMRDFRFFTDDVEDDEQVLDVCLKELQEDAIDNDQLASGSESDENESSHRKRTMKLLRRQRNRNSPFMRGDKFGSKEEVKKMIKRHVVDTRRQLRIIKDDLSRLKLLQFRNLRKRLDALKAFNSDCHLWLSNIPAKHWSRHSVMWNGENHYQIAELDEMTADGKLRKVGTFGTCGKCGNKGHNSRSCNSRRPGESGSSKAKKGGVKTTKAAKKDGKKVVVGTTMQGQVKPKKGGSKLCKKCKGVRHNSRTCQKNA